ncbi:MAG: hypothetical protein ACJ0Q1_10885 [Luminiphilus sp.]
MLSFARRSNGDQAYPSVEAHVGPEDDVLLVTSDNMLWLRVFSLVVSRLKI